MTEVRRNSRGDVLGPRPYDTRSYDDRQAPTVTTHIRTDFVVRDEAYELYHVALCGVKKPPSSITRRLYAAQQRGDLMPFNQSVVICPQCKELA